MNELWDPFFEQREKDRVVDRFFHLSDNLANLLPRVDRKRTRVSSEGRMTVLRWSFVLPDEVWPAWERKFMLSFAMYDQFRVVHLEMVDRKSRGTRGVEASYKKKISYLFDCENRRLGLQPSGSIVTKVPGFPVQKKFLDIGEGLSGLELIDGALDECSIAVRLVPKHPLYRKRK